MALEATSKIPGATTIFKIIWTDPENKRQEEFSEKVIAKMKKLGGKVVNTEDWIKDYKNKKELLNIDSHIKRDIIQNILINNLSSDWKDSFIDAEEFLFMRYYDSFCDLHFKILKFMQNPMKVLTEKQKDSIYSCSLKDVLITAFPEVKGHEDILSIIVDELNRCELISSSIGCGMTRNGLRNNRLTSFGQQFCKYFQI